MKKFIFSLPLTILLLGLASCAQAPKAAHSESAIRWEAWSDDAFARARSQNKLLILDLQAVWCHWCHVMEATTYRDPVVLRLLGTRYVALQVDQDSRPDLANRYERYGWPATIIFGPDGRELAKRAGYVAPEEMRELLARLAAKPVAEDDSGELTKPRFPITPSLAPQDRIRQEKAILAHFDFKKGGWKTSHRLLDGYLIDYALLKATAGDARAKRMARLTLDSQLKLLDPAWGGMYQYSVGDDWNEPHFEKIMSVQAENIIAYSHAYRAWRDPRDLEAAKAVDRFLADFLTDPSGAFYTSQDADLKQGEHSARFFALSNAERRKLGVPRVDRNIYARENGWAIQALVSLYAASGEELYLKRALKAARVIEDRRGIVGGGFRHGEKDAAGPYLGDTLSMARAFLALYAATGERSWLAKASSGADFIEARFRASPGYSTPAGTPAIDENIGLARFANQLFHYTGNPTYKDMAKVAMRYLAAPEIHDEIWGRAGVLLADHELGREPVHLAVVGDKGDPAARALFKEALAYPSAYLRIEWLDPREGPLPNSDVEYPQLSRAAAFACGEGRCSRPAYSPAEFRDRVPGASKNR